MKLNAALIAALFSIKVTRKLILNYSDPIALELKVTRKQAFAHISIHILD